MKKDHKSDNLFTRTVLVNPIMRASEVVRYSGIDMVKSEDILQHTAQISLMGYFIVLKLIELGEDLDVGLFLEKSILHDVDETITGDIPRPTKYYSEGITSGIQEMADRSSELLIKRYSGVVDEGLRSRPLECIRGCKEGREGAVVAVADLLGVVYKCHEEIVLLSNYKFVKVAYDSRIYLKELLEKLEPEGSLGSRFNEKGSVDYLKELVEGAVCTIEYILDLDQSKAVLHTMDYNGHSLASKFGDIRNDQE